MEPNKRVLIVGDQEEGTKYLAAARRAVATFWKANKNRNPKAQTIKPLSDTANVLIHLLNGKPRGIIIVNPIEGLRIAVMYMVDLLPSDYPDGLVPPYQPLRYKSLYLRSVTPEHRLTHYAGGRTGFNDLQPAGGLLGAAPVTLGHTGGSWRDTEYKTAISWVNTVLNEQSTVFIGGNFGVIPWPELSNTHTGFSTPHKCFIAAMKMTSPTTAVAIYVSGPANELTGVGYNLTAHLLNFQISLNPGDNLLNFTLINDLPILTGDPSSITDHAVYGGSVWSGFTSDGTMIAAYGADYGFTTALFELRVLKFNDNYTDYTIDIAMYDGSLTYNHYISFVKAEKNSFSIIHNKQADFSIGPTVASIILYSGTAFSEPTPRRTINIGVHQLVIFLYLSMDDDIYSYKIITKDFPPITVAAYLHAGSRDYSDFKYDNGEVDAVIGTQSLQLGTEPANIAANKYLTVISYSAAYQPYLYPNSPGPPPAILPCTVIIDNKSHAITEVENIDVAPDPINPGINIRYPIGLTFISTKELSGDLYITP